jgi:MFS family permease
MKREYPKYLVFAFSVGVGLVVGGPVYGLVGQFLGQPTSWRLGAAVLIVGLALTILGGVGLLIAKRSRSKSPHSNT